MNPHLTFSEALTLLKDTTRKPHARVARAGWNGKGMWLALQRPDENSKMGHPYLYMSGIDGKLFPWNPNQLDMLSDDWVEVPAQ